jgi:hypothetical protein
MHACMHNFLVIIILTLVSMGVLGTVYMRVCVGDNVWFWGGGGGNFIVWEGERLSQLKALITVLHMQAAMVCKLSTKCTILAATRTLQSE